MKQLFALQADFAHISIVIAGVKIHFQNFITQKKQIFTQNKYNLSDIRNAKDMILFLVPGSIKMNGGIMSIYSLCNVTRRLLPDKTVIISTTPGKYTYSENNTFSNNERIYRWEQVINNGGNIKNLVIHIPEYFVKKFLNSLSPAEMVFLQSIPNLQINILTQNIMLLPDKNTVASLYKLTNNITQTTAHDRYCNQELSNKFNTPVHHFSCYLDFGQCEVKSIRNKTKRIVVSPDNNEHKRAILYKLKKELPEYEIVEVKNLHFNKFLNLISDSLLTISFGEGFDGYFIIPPIVNSLGCGVYNDDFFPGVHWRELDNVYDSYLDMEANIVNLIKDLEKNTNKYISLINATHKKYDELYSKEKFEDNIQRFYRKEYDFVPHTIQDAQI